MPKVRVHNYSISLDGYGAGPHQSLENPLGAGGERLHQWVFATPSFRRMHVLGAEGETGADAGFPVDEQFSARNNRGVGATIMGRNMFGPVRGAWGDDNWRGWWGENPPFHHATFVLTHHPRDPIEMEGGTTFHFVTDGPEAALEQARAAAGDDDVQIGGGAATIQQYLRLGLIDELHVAIVPELLGAGERLFHDVGAALAGYEVTEFAASPAAAHAVLTRRKS